MNGVRLFSNAAIRSETSQNVPKTKRYSPVDICYYIAFAIYCFFHLLERTNFVSLGGVSFDLIGKIATGLMLILLCSRLFTIRFQLDSIMWSAIVLLCSLVVFFTAHSWICLSLALFIVAGKNIDIRPMVWIVLISTIVVVMITFLGVSSGLISNIASARAGETKIRYSFGFNQVNALGAAAVRIVSAVAYLRWEKNPLTFSLFALLICYLVDVVANSRTAELYIICLAAAQAAYYLLRKKRSIDAKQFGRFCLALIWVCVLISVYLLFFFNPSNSVMMTISKWVSNRFYSAWYLAKMYGVHLFGNGDMVLGGRVWAVDSYADLTIDNAWDHWLVIYGIVPTVIMLLGITKLFLIAIKSDHIDGSLIIFTLLIAVFAFGESTSLAIDYNPFLLLLWLPIYASDEAYGLKQSNSCAERLQQ